MASASTALAVYDKIDNPIAFAEQFAEAAAAMCGCDVRQGKAMALLALTEGVNLMQLRRRYHWIQGAPSMRADAMRAEFRMNYGGDFEIIENSPDRAAIRFIDAKGREQIGSVTWAEAQQEPWPWKKDCGPGTAKTEPVAANLKDNWATPLGRANMLIARATSRALRLICPELVAGIYTPEELGDSDEAPRETAKRPTASEIVASTAAATNGTVAVADAVADADGDDVQEAEFAVKAEPGPDEPGGVTRLQLDEINALMSRVFPGDKLQAAREKALANRGAQSFHNFSRNQADDLIAKLRAKDRVEASPKN